MRPLNLVEKGNLTTGEGVNRRTLFVVGRLKSPIRGLNFLPFNADRLKHNPNPLMFYLQNYLDVDILMFFALFVSRSYAQCSCF